MSIFSLVSFIFYVTTISSSYKVIALSPLQRFIKQKCAFISFVVSAQQFAVRYPKDSHSCDVFSIIHTAVSLLSQVKIDSYSGFVAVRTVLQQLKMIQPNFQYSHHRIAQHLFRRFQ